MIKKLMLLGLLVSFLSVGTQAFAEEVFRTKNGKKYHMEICRLIKNKNAVAIKKEEAVDEDGLLPCKVCYKKDIAEEEPEKE